MAPGICGTNPQRVPACRREHRAALYKHGCCKFSLEKLMNLACLIFPEHGNNGVSSSCRRNFTLAWNRLSTATVRNFAGKREREAERKREEKWDKSKILLLALLSLKSLVQVHCLSSLRKINQRYCKIRGAFFKYELWRSWKSYTSRLGLKKWNSRHA